MALTEATIQDQISAVDCGGWKSIKVRTATIISKNDSEISRSFHRHNVLPTDDWAGESAEVQAMCNTFHTTEAIAAYNAAQAANALPE